LSVLPREFLAIVGVSGSGKSTLLDALSGVRPASGGSVLVNGTDLYRNYGAYRTSVGYVPQDDIIHKELTVYSALDYAAKLRLPPDTTAGERDQRVMDVLKTLDLVSRKDTSVQRLSGGQRKRVSIGVELLTRPGLFFLDEATSALDPGTEGQIMRLLRGLADDGLTVLLVTHATKNVMLCDMVAFLAKGGHMAYFGPPDEALRYFGVDDFDAIYVKVDTENSPQEWADKYRASPQYQKYVVKRLQDKYGVLPELPATGKAAKSAVRKDTARRQGGARPNALRQFGVLTQRYLNIMTRDRVGLLLLFLIAPLLGLIDFVAWPRNVLDPVEGLADRTMVMLFMATVIPLLVASLTSVREIVKEAPIYRRERAVGLSIMPYLLSKVAILFLFALYHAAALLAIKYVAVDLTHLDLVNDLGAFYVTLALGAMSGVMWGLVISALVPREDQAMILVIIVVVAQIVFSGGLLPLHTAGDAANRIADVTPGKWVFQALVTATKVKTGDCTGPTYTDCHVPGIQALATDPEKAVLLKILDERFHSTFEGDIQKSWAALGGIIVGLFVLLWLIQKRKDVI
jgi:ABC-type multidrug transport system ATPase subunit